MVLNEGCDMNKKLFIVVTTQCNKSCYNCSYSNTMNLHKDKMFNKSKFDSIDPTGYDLLNIIGGEPGLLSINDKQYISSKIKQWNKPCLLYTNGTNLVDWPDIFTIKFHVTDFTSTIPVYNKCDYDIIVTEKVDIQSIILCIQNNPNILFRIRQDMIQPTVKYNQLKEFLENKQIPHLCDYVESSKSTISSKLIHYNKRLFNKLNHCSKQNTNFYESFSNVLKQCKCDWVLSC